MEDGYAPDLIGTDQCKGAPTDIKLVVQKPKVQEQLAAIRAQRQARRRELLGEAPLPAPAPAAAHAATATAPAVATAAPAVATAAPAVAAAEPAAVAAASTTAQAPAPAAPPAPSPALAAAAATARTPEEIKHDWDVYHCLVSVKKDWG